MNKVVFSLHGPFKQLKNRNIVLGWTALLHTNRFASPVRAWEVAASFLLFFQLVVRARPCEALLALRCAAGVRTFIGAFVEELYAVKMRGLRIP